MLKIIRKCFQKKKLNTLIIGGGNGAHIMASLIGSKKNMTTNLLTIPQEVEILKKTQQNGIKINHLDNSPQKTGFLSQITSDPSHVVPLADLILICLPANYQKKYLKQIQPYIKKKVIIGSFPGACFFNILAAKELKDKFEDSIIFATNTLPWACRLKKFGEEVDLLGVKEELEIGCFPDYENKNVCGVLQEVLGDKRMNGDKYEGNYPEFIRSSLLTMTLMNLNGLIHPSILAGNLRFLKKGNKLDNDNIFYYQGVDSYTGQLLSKIWEELFEIKDYFNKNYPSQDLSKIIELKQIIKNIYPHTIKDDSTIASCFHTNEPYQGLKYPLIEKDGFYIPNYKHRYFQEDLPTGLLPIKGIAELIGVDTPNIDRVIYWCQEWMEKEFLIDGKLKGRDLKGTRVLGNLGIESVEEFMRYFK